MSNFDDFMGEVRDAEKELKDSLAKSFRTHAIIVAGLSAASCLLGVGIGYALSKSKEGAFGVSGSNVVKL